MFHEKLIPALFPGSEKAKAQPRWEQHRHPRQSPRQQIKASAHAEHHHLLPKLNICNIQIPASDIKMNLKQKIKA